MSDSELLTDAAYALVEALTAGDTDAFNDPDNGAEADSWGIVHRLEDRLGLSLVPEWAPEFAQRKNLEVSDDA